MAYLALFGSALAGALFGQTYKWKTQLRLSTDSVLTWFSLSSVVLLSLVVWVVGKADISREAIWMPFVHGVAMVTAMRSYYRVIERARLGISWTVIQLSVIVPFFVSVTVFGESLNPASITGLLLVLAAILAFGLARNPDPQILPKGRVDRYGLFMLVSASLFTGITAALLKAFAWYHPEPKAVPTFFLLASVTLLLINLPLSLARMYRKGSTAPDPRTALFSLYKSGASMSSMAFLLLAAQQLPGYFLFPVRNTLNIMLVLAISFALHRERIGKLEAVGLICAMGGIALLSYAMR